MEIMSDKGSWVVSTTAEEKKSIIDGFVFEMFLLNPGGVMEDQSFVRTTQ